MKRRLPFTPAPCSSHSAAVGIFVFVCSWEARVRVIPRTVFFLPFSLTGIARELQRKVPPSLVKMLIPKAHKVTVYSKLFQGELPRAPGLPPRGVQKMAARRWCLRPARACLVSATPAPAPAVLPRAGTARAPCVQRPPCGQCAPAQCAATVLLHGTAEQRARPRSRDRCSQCRRLGFGWDGRARGRAWGSGPRCRQTILPTAWLWGWCCYCC